MVTGPHVRAIDRINQAYGRWLVPAKHFKSFQVGSYRTEPSENLELSLDLDPDVLLTRRRVFVDGNSPFPRDVALASENVKLVQTELDRMTTGTWTYYKTWTYKPEKLRGSVIPKNVDVLLIHGKRLTLAMSVPSL